ncbi:hypothetical protein NQ306_25995, partial [Escherichia coli]|nr:hypothetical protein [Escherichia coli]
RTSPSPSPRFGACMNSKIQGLITGSSQSGWSAGRPVTRACVLQLSSLHRVFEFEKLIIMIPDIDDLDISPCGSKAWT